MFQVHNNENSQQNKLLCVCEWKVFAGAFLHYYLEIVLEVSKRGSYLFRPIPGGTEWSDDRKSAVCWLWPDQGSHG